MTNISARSSDYSDPKTPVTTKSTETRAMVSAYGVSSGGRSVGNESCLGDVFRVGHLQGARHGRFREVEKAGMAGYGTRGRRQKLNVAALTDILSRTGLNRETTASP